MFSHEALLIICIAEAPTHPFSGADVCGAPRCTNPPRLGSFCPKKVLPTKSDGDDSNQGVPPTHRALSPALKNALYQVLAERLVGGDICSVPAWMFTCGCCENGRDAAAWVRCHGERLSQPSELKVTTARIKPPAPCMHGGTLSWGCSLQGATCQVQTVPRAEPAGQDLAQM